MRTAACLLPLLIVLAAPPSHAEEEPRPFSLGFEAGYRSVSVDGNLDKYREDVNLSDNALRLFSLDLDWRPAKESWLDELTLSAEGIGGEPYESARFTLRKAGLYDLKARYRSSDYFYADQGWYFREGGDLHTWNARRSFYDLDFSWHAAPWVTVRAGADRMDRGGGSTTTRDIQRNVFLLDRPVDQLASTYWVGADFRAGWANITVEERYASYENRWVMTSPASNGLDSGGATLDAYSQTQDQKGDAPVSRILVSGAPLEWLRFSATWARTDASLDYDVEGAWNGLDYDDSPAGNPPEPYATTLANSGSVDRNTDTWGADVTFAALDNLDLTVDYTRWSYDQDGNIASTEQQTGGKDAGTIGIQGEVHSSLSLDSWGVAADWRATSTLTVSAGAGFQTRTAEFPLAGPTVETKRSLYRAGARWRPNAVWDLFLQGETGTDEDPYTPASPTDFNRLKAELKVRPVKTLSLSARFRDETRSNGLSYPLGLPTDDTPPVSTLSGAEFSVTSWGATVDWKPVQLSPFPSPTTTPASIPTPTWCTSPAPPSSPCSTSSRPSA